MPGPALLARSALRLARCLALPPVGCWCGSPPGFCPPGASRGPGGLGARLPPRPAWAGRLLTPSLRACLPSSHLGSALGPSAGLPSRRRGRFWAALPQPLSCRHGVGAFLTAQRPWPPAHTAAPRSRRWCRHVLGAGGRLQPAWDCAAVACGAAHACCGCGPPWRPGLAFSRSLRLRRPWRAPPAAGGLARAGPPGTPGIARATGRAWPVSRHTPRSPPAPPAGPAGRRAAWRPPGPCSRGLACPARSLPFSGCRLPLLPLAAPPRRARLPFGRPLRGLYWPPQPPSGRLWPPRPTRRPAPPRPASGARSDALLTAPRCAPAPADRVRVARSVLLPLPRPAAGGALCGRSSLRCPVPVWLAGAAPVPAFAPRPSLRLALPDARSLWVCRALTVALPRFRLHRVPRGGRRRWLPAGGPVFPAAAPRARAPSAGSCQPA